MTSSKKRKASKSSPAGTKKVKSQPTTSTLTDPPAPRLKHQHLHHKAISLYNKNAQTPLLSLPREIRDQIWMYLYGNLVLHPTDKYSTNSARRNVHPLTFSICDAPHTPKTLYELSLQGASSDPSTPLPSKYLSNGEDGASTWAAPELQSHDFCAKSWQRGTAHHRHLPTDEVLKVPIVCRQMWNEMSDTVYETCTFGFTTSDDFFNFLSCRKAGLERVRKVMLAPEIKTYYSNCLDVSDLTWWSLKRLKGVRSLDLWVVWQIDMDYTRGEGVDTWSMEKKGGELDARGRKLQSLVKQLGRWDLKCDSTRVLVDVRGHGSDVSLWAQRCIPVAERVQLARQVKAGLLRQRPRRCNEHKCTSKL
ncbi:hypothetical protein DPSP01_008327 [Paraphaeosphaeria sporulosa]